MADSRPNRSLNRADDGSATLQPFAIKDCALTALASGQRAQNLKELLVGIHDVDTESIYHHFWGRLLQPLFDEPEYSNDFAVWAANALHDRVLAERLAVVDPTEFTDLDELRRELIEEVEERLDESEAIVWARRDQQFHFLTTKLVVFDTRHRVTDPRDLVEMLPSMSRGSVFYHFIDARTRQEDGLDDFRSWLRGGGDMYEGLAQQLAEVEPFFSSLGEIREQLAHVFTEYFREVGS